MSRDRRCGIRQCGLRLPAEAEKQGIFLFFRTSRQALDPPIGPFNGQREVKWLEREATRSLASRVEVNEWSCASTRRPLGTTTRLALHVVAPMAGVTQQLRTSGMQNCDAQRLLAPEGVTSGYVMWRAVIAMVRRSSFPYAVVTPSAKRRHAACPMYDTALPVEGSRQAAPILPSDKSSLCMGHRWNDALP